MVNISCSDKLYSGKCYFINGICCVFICNIDTSVIDLSLHEKKLKLMTFTGKKYVYDFNLGFTITSELLMFKKCKSIVLEKDINSLKSDDFYSEYVVIDIFKWHKYCENNYIKLSSEYDCDFLVDEFLRNSFVIKCMIAGKDVFAL